METLDRDLAYIMEHKLSIDGQVLHLNTFRKTKSSNKEIHLPLFSQISNKQYWLNKMAEFYKEDFLLFGYSYQVRNGQVYGVCKQHDNLGDCL